MTSCGPQMTPRLPSTFMKNDLQMDNPEGKRKISIGNMHLYLEPNIKSVSPPIDAGNVGRSCRFPPASLNARRMSSSIFPVSVYSGKVYVSFSRHIPFIEMKPPSASGSLTPYMPCGALTTKSPTPRMMSGPCMV